MHALYLNMCTLLSQAACQPAVFRLLAVAHVLGRNVPPGTSVTAKHMLALCSTYYYHLLF